MGLVVFQEGAVELRLWKGCGACETGVPDGPRSFRILTCTRVGSKRAARLRTSCSSDIMQVELAATKAVTRPCLNSVLCGGPAPLRCTAAPRCTRRRSPGALAVLRGQDPGAPGLQRARALALF